MKKAIKKIRREQAIEDGAYDGRFSPKVQKLEKHKKPKYKGVWEKE